MPPKIPRQTLLRNIVVDARPRSVSSRVRVAQGQSITPFAGPGVAAADASLPTLHPPSVSRSMRAAPQEELLRPQVDEARLIGHREGRAEGLREGLKDASTRIEDAVRTARSKVEADAHQVATRSAAELAARLAGLDAAIDALEQATADMLQRLDTEAMGLAFEALCQLLGDDARHVSVLGSLVSRALEQVKAQPLRVRVSARDLAMLEGLEPVEALATRHARLEWIADDRVTSGGCIVDTAVGSLDARLELQMSRLLDAWRSEWNRVQGAPTEETA